MNPQNPNIFQTLKNTNFLLTPLGNSNTETDINVAEYANKKQFQNLVTDERLWKARDDYHQQIRKSTFSSAQVANFMGKLSRHAENEIARVNLTNQKLVDRVQTLQTEVRELKYQLQYAMKSINQIISEKAVQKNVQEVKSSASVVVQRKNNFIPERPNIFNKQLSNSYVMPLPQSFMSQNPPQFKFRAQSRSPQKQSNLYHQTRHRSVSWESNNSYNTNRSNVEKKKYQRQIPENSCSYSAAMDLLERGIFSKYTGFQREKIPEISQLVNGYRSHSNYESFIRMISRPEYAHFLKPGRLQDCWKIVNLVQDLMIENGYSKQQVTHRPVIACNDCQIRRKATKYYQGNLMYVFNGHSFQIRKMLCGDCDKAISPSILFYPDEFLMKVTDIQINRTSSSQRPNLPKFQGYWISCIIQYNEKLKHYRTLRFSGNNTITIIDGNIYMSQSGLSWEDKKSIIYEQGWLPYILQFRKSQYKGKTSFKKVTERIRVENEMDECIGGTHKYNQHAQ